MKFVQFYSGTDDTIQTGLLTCKGVLPLRALSDQFPITVKELCLCGNEILTQIQSLAATASDSAYISESEIRYAPAVTGMEKALCVGLNYRRHAVELGLALPSYPTIFCKLANTYTSHKHNISFPARASHVDYEAELVIVMGSENQIWGYTCGNDLSIREWQNETTQWIVGKNADGFAPIGPCVVDAASLTAENLHIESRVNGEVRQSSNTSDMIFNCRQIVDYINTRIPLKAGDIIFTGTPSGVIQGLPADKQNWLSVGDTVEIEIEDIGVLQNTFSK